MKIGAMNNPEKDIYSEIEYFAEHGFDFIDLTVEPGASSYSEDIDVKRIAALVKKHRLNLIGHTPWNLPFASPYKQAREAAFGEFMKCIEIFSEIGVTLANVHIQEPNYIKPIDELIRYNAEFFRKIVKASKNKGIAIMMENAGGVFSDAKLLKKLLVPGLKLHWDVGHANLGRDTHETTENAFREFKDRIVHLHFSDNNGIDDLHLPLGAGNIDWPKIIKILKEYKYNKTITLEVFSPDRDYLLASRDKLRRLLR
jgi:sugar phosphate isomerase/epimerase